MNKAFEWLVILILTIAAIKLILTAIATSIANLFEVLFIDYGLVTLIFVGAVFYWWIQAKKLKEKERLKALADKLEHRDADVQKTPYRYEVSKHANQTLAIRYGIANTTKKTVPYYYYAKGGVKKRNPDRDKIKIVDANTILLRKIKPLSEDNCYLVELTSFKKRKAIAIHHKGEDGIRTFYPINTNTNTVDEQWWGRNKELEIALKDNKTFSLKELATFHVNKTVPITSR